MNSASRILSRRAENIMHAEKGSCEDYSAHISRIDLRHAN